MQNKHILLMVQLISFSLLANELTIEKSCIIAPQKLGSLKITHSKNDFKIIEGSKVSKVNRYDVDPVLRKMNNEQLAKVLLGAKIKVSQLSNKDYRLELAGGLKGGGIGGAQAGFWTGKFFTHLVFQSGIVLISLGSNVIVPGSGPIVAAALEKTLVPVAEYTSNVVAIGCGIAGGAATGPV